MLLNSSEIQKFCHKFANPIYNFNIKLQLNKLLYGYLKRSNK